MLQTSTLSNSSQLCNRCREPSNLHGGPRQPQVRLLGRSAQTQACDKQASKTTCASCDWRHNEAIIIRLLETYYYLSACLSGDGNFLHPSQGSELLGFAFLLPLARLCRGIRSRNDRLSCKTLRRDTLSHSSLRRLLLASLFSRWRAYKVAEM